MKMEDIRARLLEKAELHNDPELVALAEATRRRPWSKSATKSRTFTPELAERIREYAAIHPLLHQREIANVFNVNSGRVSEALRGTRT